MIGSVLRCDACNQNHKSKIQKGKLHASLVVRVGGRYFSVLPDDGRVLDDRFPAVQSECVEFKPTPCGSNGWRCMKVWSWKRFGPRNAVPLVSRDRMAYGERGNVINVGVNDPLDHGRSGWLTSRWPS
jgi:hypothetical protein